MIKVKEDMTGWKMAEHDVDGSRIVVLQQIEDYVSPSGKHYSQWLCECMCDEHNRFVALGQDIRDGGTKSCGCLQEELGLRRKKYNTYDLSGEYGIGWTSNTNEEFYFDLEDFDKIKDYCWSVGNRNKNYKRIVSYDNISSKGILLHSLITGYKLCDHINRDTFDNRKSNLREVTHQENMRNHSIRCDNVSGFTGVYFQKARNKWRSQIEIDGRSKHLGCFENKEDAIRARLKAEAKYYGEFAPQRHLFEEYGIKLMEGS